MLFNIIGKSNGSNETPSQSAAPAAQPASSATTDRPLSSAPRAEALRILPKGPALSSTPKTGALESGVEIKGTLKSSHDLFFDGRIEGEIHSAGALTVGENACIKGDIRSRSVVILGKVEGNIAVQERCELKNKADVVGDINAGSLSIEEGASFTGLSKAGKQSATAAPAPPARMAA